MKKIMPFIFLLLIVVPCKNVKAAPLVENFIDCRALDEKMEAELNEIALFFQTGEMKLLSKRLNDELLLSPDRLQKELEMLESYTCLERENVEEGAKQKLEIYVSMLNYFQKMFEQEEMSKINELSLEITGVDYLYQLTATFDDRKELEITYFTGTMAAVKFYEIRMEKLEDANENNMLRWLVFVETNIVDPLGSLVLENPVIRAMQYFKQQEQQKVDENWKSELQSGLTASSVLKMEFAIVEGDENQYRNVDLYPTTYTYQLLDRWKEVYEINPDIPYPEKDIQNENWIEIGDFLLGSQLEMEEYGHELNRYIFDGKLPDTHTVEDVANGKK